MNGLAYGLNDSRNSPWTLEGKSGTYKTNAKNYWLGHTHTSVGVSLLGSMV